MFLLPDPLLPLNVSAVAELKPVPELVRTLLLVEVWLPLWGVDEKGLVAMRRYLFQSPVGPEAVRSATHQRHSSLQWLSMQLEIL